jgi:hypothetical protein
MVHAGGDEAPVPALRLSVAPDSVATYRILVRAPLTALSGVSTPLHVTVNAKDTGDGDIYNTVFMGPQ